MENWTSDPLFVTSVTQDTSQEFLKISDMFGAVL